MSEIFAKRLREVRENKKKTQGEIAKLIGISAVAYGGWERAEAEPSFINLIRLCTFFNVSSDWLIGLDLKSPEHKQMIMERVNSLKTEAEQAAATLTRLTDQIKEMERHV